MIRSGITAAVAVVPSDSASAADVGEHIGYCILTLAARTTLPHFAVSSATNLPNSAGVVVKMPPPSAPICALILGAASAVLISWLSVSTMSAGVLLGAPMPTQVLAS